MTTTNDHDYEVEGPDGDITGACGHCYRPCYATPDGTYHHAVNSALGCFLIGPEDRVDDVRHPLYRAYTTWEEPVVDLICTEYAATIQPNGLATLFRLRWTDGVTGDWSENYYTLAAALIRLGALDFCKGGEIFFTTEAEQFNGQAHAFLATVTA